MLTWISSPAPKGDRFVLLDRDGVLNLDNDNFIKNRQEYHFFPDALESLSWMNRHHINVILISNQSALGRGITTWDDFWTIHEHMVQGIREAGGDVLAAFYCPHCPDDGCNCRKPSPGMILAARRLYGFLPAATYMIGDKITDLLAAENAGCPGILLDRFPLERKPGVSEGSPFKSHRRFLSLPEAVQSMFGHLPGP